MGDVVRSGPDYSCVFETACEQGGYFSAAQARVCGFRQNLLTYITQQGKFIRIRRGLYRLRDYPSSPREEVMAAWLALGKEKAVVSHDSALDLLDLSDVIPDAVHLTVPRSTRHLPTLRGVKIHTTTRPLRPTDVVVREGVRLTSAARTILDAAQAGTAPEQIEMAVVQALDRGLATRRELEEDAVRRSRRVRQLVEVGLDRAAG